MISAIRKAAERVGPLGTGVLVHTLFHAAGGASAGAVISWLLPDAHAQGGGHGGAARSHILFGAVSGLLSGIAMEIWMRRAHRPVGTP